MFTDPVPRLGDTTGRGWTSTVDPYCHRDNGYNKYCPRQFGKWLAALIMGIGLVDAMKHPSGITWCVGTFRNLTDDLLFWCNVYNTAFETKDVEFDSSGNG